MITIVDYQMGNLRSVENALNRMGVEARVSSVPDEIANAEKLILPGVGGFGEAIDEIRRRDLERPILDFIDSGRPFLGICLGLQLLFETGYEGGIQKGLGCLPGEVVRFDIDPALKVPHMGWNTVFAPKEFASAGGESLMKNIPDGAHFYFVHSYYVRPADPKVVALCSDYGGAFCAMVQSGNIYATQFHPEKSQRDGLQMLANFAALPSTSMIA
jgi:glutamine amidotransferase